MDNIEKIKIKLKKFKKSKKKDEVLSKST